MNHPPVILFRRMASSNASRSEFTGIVTGGLVAETVDLGAAALMSLVSPVIARYIADTAPRRP